MATKVIPPTSTGSLASVKVYMHPVQLQRVRELAARRGVSMSEFVKQLIDREQRGSMNVD